MEAAFAVLGFICLVAFFFIAGAFCVVIFRCWFVDQTLHAGEAVGLLGAMSMLVVGTIMLARGPLVFLPSGVGIVSVFAFRRLLALRQKQAHAAWLAGEEAKARSMLARDPSAIVGYERLAEVLLEQARRDEALEILLAWQRREPHQKHLGRRIDALRAELARETAPSEPALPPVDPMLLQRQTVAGVSNWGVGQRSLQAEPEDQPPPSGPIDFATVPEPVLEPDPEPAVLEEIVAFGPGDAVDEAPALAPQAELDLAEAFAPGSRAFDLHELAFDPESEGQGEDDGFHTDPSDLTKP